MKIKVYFLILILTISSCVSPEKIVYFQNDEIEKIESLKNLNTVLKPDDLLEITISSADIEASKPFNKVNSSTENQNTYLISSNGSIDFPVLGEINVFGKTKKEVKEIIKNKLDPDYIINPVVNIKIKNYSITILGEVNNPGTFTIPNEQTTILEAIGLAGDLKISGRRENIKVIRENNNEKKIYTVDIRSNKIFNSPVYYLQQNDVVYVEPNKAASQSAAVNKNTNLYFSLITLTFTILNFIL